MQTNMRGPSWDLSSEYSDTQSADLKSDLAEIDTLLGRAQSGASQLAAEVPGAQALSIGEAEQAVSVAQDLQQLLEEVSILVANLAVYASCLLSVDSQDQGARDLQGRLIALQKRRDELLEPLRLFLDRVGDEVVELYLRDERVAPSRFQVMHSRKRRQQLLSLEEERLIKGLAQDGIHAWGRLYDQLSGTISCEVRVGGETRQLGLAEASGLMMNPDDSIRESAWHAINAAWTTQEESCAAAINAISGWRLESCRRRSSQQPVHYLDEALHDNRISQAVLDALMSVAAQAAPVARRVCELQARAYGKTRYSPWDLRAPAPATLEPERETSYATALDWIREAYASIDPEMGEFVQLMDANAWIEGTVSPRKRPGAYCTRFAKSRTPRVYMTYTGGSSNIITLAHELGHAFHNWVMRDLPRTQCEYGMSLAETASTLGEAVVREALLERAESQAARFAILWAEMDALTAFVLNIPTRFDFENAFYRAREQRPLRPDELKSMMSTAWQNWYGECLSQPDPMFWASKLHFYISGRSFYNFPYLFGYLFSNGVFARRTEMGEAFFANYRALLRDTGSMTAVHLAKHHLGVDLEQPDFWQATITMLAARAEEFETLCKQLYPAAAAG